MKRILILLLCLLAGAALAQQKRALLVGVTGYPFIAQDDRLQGGDEDLVQMGNLLSRAGFTMQKLAEKAATKAAIEKALSDIEAGAGSGDRILFYFSGRGSVNNENGATTDLEPTLVPIDGKAADASGDIPMSRLEALAGALKAKGADLTVILDCSFEKPTDPRTRGEYRAFDPIPRTVQRPGKVRRTLFQGDAAVFSATGTTGCAYEWRTNYQTKTWKGAFTDLFSTIGLDLARKNTSFSPADIMEQVCLFMGQKAKQGYMKDQTPSPQPGDLRPAHRQTLFASRPLEQLSPQDQQFIKAWEARRLEEDRVLRIALELPTNVQGPARVAATTKWLGPLTDNLEKTLARDSLLPVRVIEQYEGRPDIVLTVTPSGADCTIEVQGDEYDEKANVRFTGATPTQVLNEGLADYLTRQAAGVRVFRLAQWSAPTLSLSEDAIRLKSEYRIRGPWFFKLVEPLEGLFFITDRDWDGRVQLICPDTDTGRNWVTSQDVTFPKGEFGIIDGTPAGRTDVRILFVQAPPNAFPMPAIPDDLKGMARNRASWKAQVAHIRAVLEAVQAGRHPWAMVSTSYLVRP